MKKSCKKDSPEFVYEYLDKNCDATFTDYKQDFPNTKVTSMLFGQRKYFWKNKLKGRDKNPTKSMLAELSAANLAISKLKYEDSNAFINEYLSINIEKTLSDLKAEFPQCKMKAGTFYSRKHHFKAGTLISSRVHIYTKRKNNSLYMTIWEKDIEEMKDDVKKIIKDTIQDLINSVAESTKINWQLVELADPKRLELREIAK